MILKSKINVNLALFNADSTDASFINAMSYTLYKFDDAESCESLIKDSVWFALGPTSLCFWED